MKEIDTRKHSRASLNEITGLDIGELNLTSIGNACAVRLRGRDGQHVELRADMGTLRISTDADEQ